MLVHDPRNSRGSGVTIWYIMPSSVIFIFLLTALTKQSTSTDPFRMMAFGSVCHDTNPSSCAGFKSNTWVKLCALDNTVYGSILEWPSSTRRVSIQVFIRRRSSEQARLPSFLWCKPTAKSPPSDTDLLSNGDPKWWIEPVHPWRMRTLFCNSRSKPSPATNRWNGQAISLRTTNLAKKAATNGCGPCSC